jgi:hypothetical protein
LDERMELLPPGMVGEIYVGGAGLARGYSKRAELTAERFLPDPFSKKGGGRLYRTGDLGRFRGDGSLEYVGRKDEQVKVRGHRIELGEIEWALGRYEGLSQGVVVVREDVPGDKRLVGYVVWEEGREGTVQGLKEHLKRTLPEYMVPGMFVLLPEIPRTVNGKVDRTRLPAPEGRAERTEEYVAPSSEVERGVAEVWKEVLGTATVGRHDNFFDLGGHSLLLVQVHEKLRSRFPETTLSVVDLFELPTIATLAQRLHPATATSTDEQSPRHAGSPGEESGGGEAASAGGDRAGRERLARRRGVRDRAAAEEEARDDA